MTSPGAVIFRAERDYDRGLQSANPDMTTEDKFSAETQMDEAPMEDSPMDETPPDEEPVIEEDTIEEEMIEEPEVTDSSDDGQPQ